MKGDQGIKRILTSPSPNPLPSPGLRTGAACRENYQIQEITFSTVLEKSVFLPAPPFQRHRKREQQGQAKKEHSGIHIIIDNSRVHLGAGAGGGLSFTRKGRGERMGKDRREEG